MEKKIDEAGTNLLGLKRNALMLGLCGKYKGKWDGCNSKRELVKMALDSNGIEFMADSIAFGWGLGRSYLMGEFGEFMNGFYQCHEDGYMSEMYVGAHGVMEVRSTLLLLAYCDGLEVDVPEHTVCRIYVCGGSRVKVENKGRCEIYEYGEDNGIDYVGHDGAFFRRERIFRSKWIVGSGDER